MARAPIYLDHHATTPLDSRALEAMLPYLKEHFGNAASKSHVFGWRAEGAVEAARKQVAELIGASEQEIVFTSGATESNNLAIKGVVELHRNEKDHVVTVTTEHKSVLDPCAHLQRFGTKVTYVGVERDGRVSLDALREAMTARTVLVSVMLANNEIGTVQPVAEIGALCRERSVLFHTDAAQGAGKIAFDVEKANADLVSLSAHKLYGPKGVGALYVRRKPRVHLASLIDGGGHERGLRSGTLNVPGIVGFGKAAQLCQNERETDAARVLGLRERLRTKLFSCLDGLTLNGALEPRLPGNLNVSFAGVEGEALMLAMREVAVSSGSACTSASLEPSYVLRACGIDDELARASIRFGIGRTNTEEEIDYVGQLVVEKVRMLRAVHA
ncbi:MAG: IscS subfamily cysteine desulfurase [Myxococcota bacterium]